MLDPQMLCALSSRPALVQANLSGSAFSDDWLWVVGDEACGVVRLRRLDPVGSETLRFGEVRDFPLVDLLGLPGAVDEEADLEGMAVSHGWLWVVGSHGLKRKNAKEGWDPTELKFRGSFFRPMCAQTHDLRGFQA